MAVSALKSELATPRDFAADFAAFASRLTLNDLPRDVVAAAKTNVFDTLSCAIAGVSAAGVKEMTSLITGWGGAPQASILCSDQRVPAHHAAWINGMMAHARDYDDTHDGAILHAGVSVVPAALAAAELNQRASGADLIAGIVAGLELICRLGVATKIGIIESGFIYTSLFGHFAATAAAARVMNFDADQTVNALGVAYSQAAGTHQVTRDAALTKRIQPGFAAKTALISVAMTSVGIRGAQNTFEGVDGLFRTYLHGRYDPEVLRDRLGSRYEFTNLGYKFYPCCRFNHTAIDAALQIRRQLGGSIRGIRRITARVNRQAYEAVCTPTDIRKHPKSVVQAQFSIPFTVACALVNGKVGLADFSESGIGDPAILYLAQRVDGIVDDQIEKNWSRSISPTHLVVDTDQGIVEARVDTPRGHPEGAVTTADFDEKLRDCIGASGLAWPDDTAQRLRGCVDHLETLPQGAQLLRPLLRP